MDATREFSNFAGKGVFYNLCQQEDVLKEIAEFTGLGVDELKQPHFRHRELLHSECCALWAHVLKKMFPEAHVVRDFDFVGLDQIFCKGFALFSGVLAQIKLERSERAVSGMDVKVIDCFDMWFVLRV